MQAQDKQETENHPLVSIIVNCFNGQKFLREALESIFSQTYTNWEVIFWDNQSTDESAKIFKSYKDDRLKYVYAPKHTIIYEARNYAVEYSSGEFVAFLDVDDGWFEKKLSCQIPLFDNPDVGFVCSKALILEESSGMRRKLHEKNIPTGWVVRELISNYSLIMSSLVIRRSAYDSINNGFDKSLHILGDMDFMIRLATSWKLDCAQEELMFYRLHGENIGQTQRELHAKELKVVVEKLRSIDKIKELQEFEYLKHQLTYIEGRHKFEQKEWREAVDRLFKLPFGKLKLKLLILCITPTYVLRKLGLIRQFNNPK